ncbi:MAG: 2-amino-4-hydroxy-6-hydroxymethyldihydropteridine diphosphokinase [Candidatus Omnitrophica bacterium]|nr:2-amino-4-hydroxy-6-hydroxymethyldihydropteridine diphosphokinase [Candidatus Omnitrophota bacterium]
MATAFIGVGSNIGDRETFLNLALGLLKQDPSIKVEKTSPVYETDPVSGIPQGKYLNAVWQVSTDLTPERLLDVLRGIEKALGRERKERFSPRTIDLDILFYDQFIYSSERLTVPHPRLHERFFVLRPLADLSPDLLHPMIRRSVKDLLGEVERKLGVQAL